MKAYVFYTNSVISCLELLEQSCAELEDLEIVRLLGGDDSTKSLAGQTGTIEYMKLMLSRWLRLPELIEENVGSKILFIDSDIVFNRYKKDTIRNIELFLDDYDLVTQYDDNSGMSAGVNMGFLGINCTSKALVKFSEFMDLISTLITENPPAGYPQIQFNDYLIAGGGTPPLDYKVLSCDYGQRTSNCRFYHAIGVGGCGEKVNAMKSALYSFDQNK